MLIKFKKSSKNLFHIKSETLQRYSGQYDKISPNNKKVIAYLSNLAGCKIKNAYNLYDSNQETLGILFCKLLYKNSLGGIELCFLPLGSDGFYTETSCQTLYNAVFKFETNLDKPYWTYTDSFIPDDLRTSIEVQEFTSSDDKLKYRLSNIEDEIAAPKIIIRLSDLVERIYNTDFGITKAYNKISFDDLNG